MKRSPLDRCLKYLAKMPDAISGAGGHNAAIAAACACYRFGLSDEDAWTAIQWFNDNKTGSEPWSEKELRHKLADARKIVDADGTFGKFLRDDGTRNSKRTSSSSHGAKGAAPKSRKSYTTPEEAIAVALWQVQADVRRKGADPQAVHLTGSWSYPGDAMRILRFDWPDDKSYRPIHLEGDRWFVGDPADPLPLYRGNTVADASIVTSHEGEKCCDRAVRLDFIAVTSSHGAGSAHRTDWAPLRRKEVWIFADHDKKGMKHALQVAAILTALGCKVKIIELPGLGDGEDIYDWTEPDGPAGAQDDVEIKARIEAIAEGTPYWTPPPEDAPADMGNDAPVADSDDAPADTDGRAIHVQATLCSDIGNAARFVEREGRDYRYCGAWGKWLHWDGCRWKPDDAGRVIRAAKRVALSIYSEAKIAAEADDNVRSNQLVKHAQASQKRERLTAMVALAQCELAVSPDDLDRDLFSLNVQNGTVNLRTGERHDHRREDLITKLAPVTFDASAACPLWLSVLDRIMAGKQDRVSYLQRIAGLSLTGDVSEQECYFFYGVGANGKNVTLDTLTGILGDYAGEAAPDLLIERRNPEHPTILADLCGRRLVVCSELPEGGRLHTNLLKAITGNARIKARYMKQDYFEFARTFKIIVATNHRPVVRESTLAIWRRLRLVPFEVIIPPEEQDRNLLTTLKNEWPGILNWAIAGCLAWQKDGMQTPNDVLIATKAYQDEEDVLADFLESRCLLAPNAFTSRADMYANYKSWADKEQERYPLNKNALFERLRGKPGIQDGQRRIGNKAPTRGFNGVGLLSPLLEGTPYA
jgi:putative DNA primase/helicase